MEDPAAASAPVPTPSAQEKRFYEAAGPPEIDPAEIEFDRVKDFIGEGTFGKVYRGKCRGQSVAVKVPARQNLTPKQLEEFRHEVEIMKRIFHPNVVLFLGACTQPNNILIVTELMAGDLETVIHSSPPKPIEDRLRMMNDCAFALNWLHGINNCVHRDLKPANLLITEQGRVKVTDFGFGQIKSSDDKMKDEKGPKGSALWMAPEVMMRKPFDEKIDVYSFGLILWETVTGGTLFEQYEDFRPFVKAVCQQHERPTIPSDVRPKLAKLMQDCWAPDPNQRPSFKEILFRLAEVTIEYTIRDHEARSFWTQHYLVSDQTLQEKVLWRDFITKLSAETGVNVHDLKGLSSLFSIKSQEVAREEQVVTMKHFNQLVDWFGPFFTRDRGPAILAWILELLSKPWFHGDLSLEVAERRLQGRAEGFFLVRLSARKLDHPYTISVLRSAIPCNSDSTPRTVGPSPQHKRIHHLAGVDRHCWVVPVHGLNKTFTDLFELVDYADMGLTHACPKEEITTPYLNNYYTDGCHDN